MKVLEFIYGVFCKKNTKKETPIVDERLTDEAEIVINCFPDKNVAQFNVENTNNNFIHSAVVGVLHQQHKYTVNE